MIKKKSFYFLSFRSRRVGIYHLIGTLFISCVRKYVITGSMTKTLSLELSRLRPSRPL